MAFNKITRNVNGIDYSVSIEHVPDRKRPELCVMVGDGVLYKVGEITDENTLMLTLAAIFHDVKVIEDER